MINRILEFLENIFFIEEQDAPYDELMIEKTRYYSENLDDLYIDKIYVACHYEKNIQKDLKNLKYHYNKKSLDKMDGYLSKLYDLYLKEEDKEKLLIMGIPIFFLQSFMRGYNQTYLLGEKMSERIGIDFIKPVVKKNYTRSQAGRSRKERLENLKDCFQLDKRFKTKIVGKTVIIVDDVISTGTTANEIAKILKKNGVGKVIGIFLSTGS